MDEHVKFMRKALKEAAKGGARGEVPIGAIIVSGNKIIAHAYNMTEKNHDPTLHAEIISIKRATKKLSNFRLNGATLYVTAEPCIMCVGAIYRSRISHVVYGCKNKKGGALGSILDLRKVKKENHKFKTTGGILEDECREILKDFFSKRRNFFGV